MATLILVRTNQFLLCYTLCEFEEKKRFSEKSFLHIAENIKILTGADTSSSSSVSSCRQLLPGKLLTYILNMWLFFFNSMYTSKYWYISIPVISYHKRRQVYWYLWHERYKKYQIPVPKILNTIFHNFGIILYYPIQIMVYRTYFHDNCIP